MVPQLGASSYGGCGEWRQSHWLSCPNQIFIIRLCLHQPFRLVAQHTAFQDLEIVSGLVWLMNCTTISVIVVPIATGTLF